MSEKNYKKMSSSYRETWSCQECKTKGGQTITTSNTITVDDIFQLMTDIKKEQATINKKLSDVIESQKFIAVQYDDIKLKLDQIEVLGKELKKCQEHSKVQEKRITELEQRLIKTEQYARRSQLEINGVPETVGENLETVVTNIVSKLKINIKPEEIETVHRIPVLNKTTRRSPPTIIVEFANRKKRDEILANKSTLKVSFNEIGNQIYIHESLSQFFKNLLWRVRNSAKEKGYRFVWYKNYKILVKKDVNSQTIVINNENELNKI